MREKNYVVQVGVRLSEEDYQYVKAQAETVGTLAEAVRVIISRDRARTLGRRTTRKKG